MIRNFELHFSCCKEMNLQSGSSCWSCQKLTNEQPMSVVKHSPKELSNTSMDTPMVCHNSVADHNGMPNGDNSIADHNGMPNGDISIADHNGMLNGDISIADHNGMPNGGVANSTVAADKVVNTGYVAYIDVPSEGQVVQQKVILVPNSSDVQGTVPEYLFPSNDLQESVPACQPLTAHIQESVPAYHNLQSVLKPLGNSQIDCATPNSGLAHSILIENEPSEKSIFRKRKKKQISCASKLKMKTKKVPAAPTVDHCYECGKIFFRDTDIKTHRKIHPMGNVEPPSDEVKQYSCPICKTAYKDADFLIRHLKRLTGEMDSELDDVVSLECVFCGLMLCSADDLIKHMEEHIKEQITINKCYVCDSTLDRSRAYCEQTCHAISTTERGGHLCMLCNKRFCNRASKWRHMDGVHGFEEMKMDDNSYKCTICNEISATIKEHSRHFEGHPENAMRYSCHLCSYTTMKRYSFQGHQMSHSGFRREKDYCKICDKEVASLSSHSPFHMTEKNVKCDFCEKRFVTIGYMKSHAKAVHTHKDRYKCSYCGKGAPNVEALDNHERTHTKEKPFICEHCGMAFAARSNLCAHRKKHKDEVMEFDVQSSSEEEYTLDSEYEYVYDHEESVDA